MTSPSSQTIPPEPSAGPACERSSVPPWLRLVLTFGALFALKWLLPLLGVAATAQVLVLLATATILARVFWWSCGVDRRGVFLLIGSLWIAGLAKIALR